MADSLSYNSSPLSPPFTPTIQFPAKPIVDYPVDHHVLLLNPFPPPPASPESPVQPQTTSPSSTTIPPNHSQNDHLHLLPQHTNLAPPESPSQITNASPSIGFSSLSLRTPSSRPLPSFLPPAPRVSSGSSQPQSQKQSRPAVSTLRANYTRMLKKPSSPSSTRKTTMPPPSTIPQSTSTPVMDDLQTFADFFPGEYETPPPKYHPRASTPPLAYEPWESRNANSLKGHLHPDTASSRSLPNTGTHADYHIVSPSALVSPDMPPADSAVGLGYASAGLPGLFNHIDSASGPATAEDFETILTMLQPPSTSFIPNLPLPPTPVSATLSSNASFTSPLFHSSPYPSTPAVDALAAFGISPDIASTSPATLNLLDDFEFPLFTDNMTTSSKPQSSGSTNGATVNLMGLQLKTSLSRNASWEQQPPSAGESSSASSLSPPSASTHGLASPPASSVASSSIARPPPNGVRKNVKPNDLIPIDAPIQPRNYITPSSTSRKEIPPSVARTFVPNSSRKRTASQVRMEEDELEDESRLSPEEAERRKRMREMDPEKAALLDHVESARRRNTLAARKSRQRKLEHVRGLEELVERLQAENEELRTSKDDVLKENEELKEKIRTLEARLNQQ